MTENFLELTVDKFTFRVKEGLLYAESGVWVALGDAAGTARLGLTDFRQQSSGDVAFVELPSLGTNVTAGNEVARIETIKVDLEVPAPFAGQVVGINAALGDRPELINQDPYGEGWLLDLQPARWPVEGLLDAQAYLAVMESQAAEAAS